MEYHNFTIVLSFFISVICGKECGIKIEGKKNCCDDYRYMDGICIECPKGFFGEECSDPCPSGQYGIACRETCNCTIDQICDAKEGCIYNNADSTTDIFQTAESPIHNDEIIRKYLLGVLLGVLMTGMILLLICIRMKWKLGDEASGLNDGQHVQDAGSHVVQENQNAVYSDYAEICELDAPCSHTLTISIDRDRKEGNQDQQKPTMTHLIIAHLK